MRSINRWNVLLTALAWTACQGSEKQSESDATVSGSDAPAAALETAPARDAPAANRDASMANDTPAANRDAPADGINANKADAPALASDMARDIPPVVDAWADAPTTPPDATTDAALYCTVNGRPVPNGARAYYLNCNACYCSMQAPPGGVWCNSSGCPAPDAGLYTCPSGLTSLTYGQTGGFVAYRDSSTMNPTTWSYTHSRTYVDAGTPALTCTMSLSPCYSSSGEVFGRLRNDLAAPEVAAAFALSTPPLFGHDLRPVDGSVFSIEHSDGHGILVGSPCPSGSTSPCTPIPASIQQLVDDLKSLDQQMLEMQPPSSATACAVFR